MGDRERSRVQVIHRETIKPSSPTPLHPKTHKLCLVDQLSPIMNVPLLLFYPHSNGVDEVHHHRLSISEKTKFLRTTLSQTLTHFHPLAGRTTTVLNFSRPKSTAKCRR